MNEFKVTIQDVVEIAFLTYSNKFSGDFWATVILRIIEQACPAGSFDFKGWEIGFQNQAVAISNSNGQELNLGTIRYINQKLPRNMIHYSKRGEVYLFALNRRNKR